MSILMDARYVAESQSILYLARYGVLGLQASSQDSKTSLSVLRHFKMRH